MAEAPLANNWLRPAVLEVNPLFNSSLDSESHIVIIGEQVAFSSRIQLLVSKLGRSSKPSPRFLVVVSQYPFCCTQGIIDYCLN